MIPFKVKRKTYYLPTSYGEVPVGKLIKLPEVANDPTRFFPFLLDCPHAFDPTPLLPFVEWMSEKIDLTAYEPAEDVPDIRAYAWGKKINSEDLLRSNAPIVSMLKIVALYFGADMQPLLLKGKELSLSVPEKIELIERQTKKAEEGWMSKPLNEVCPVYMNIAAQINAILTMEKDMLKTETDAEQVEAGINEFSQLGHMNTIDLIAGGDVLKYDAVLLIDYNTIFAKLLKLNISNKFTTRYREIVRRNAKTKGK